MTAAHGETHYRAKFTERDIWMIRAWRGRLTQPMLAKAFQTTQGTISKIQTGMCWR